MSPFIRIHNKVIRLDSIAYVDFLESGRAMIFMRGLTQEKQNIPVDPDETIRLRSLLEAHLETETPAPQTTRNDASKSAENRRWS